MLFAADKLKIFESLYANASADISRMREGNV